VIRVLVVQTARLGDAVLTTPLLDALASRYGPVDVVTTPAVAPLLETHPAVRRVIPFDKRGDDRGLSGLRRAARRIREQNYREAYLPHGSWRSALLARLAGVPNRVGFDDAPGRWLYTRPRPRPAGGTHQADRLLSLAGDSEPGRPSRSLSLGLTPDDRAGARRALGRWGVPVPFVAIAPGAARATKRWPHFAQLCRLLADQVGVVAIGGPEDRSLRLEPAVNFAGLLSPRESAAVLALAQVAVTNDSFALHAAQAVGTPVVALFGPSLPEMGFGPRGPRDRALGVAGLACRPCSVNGGRRCPMRHHRCMIALEPETVRDTLMAMLSPTPSPPPALSAPSAPPAPLS